MKRQESSDSKLQMADNPIVAAANAAGFRTFRTCAVKATDNASFSPFSILLALGIAGNGAAGETQQEITRSLTSHGNIEEFNKYLEDNQEALLASNAASGFIFDIANAVIFHESCGALKQAFREKLEKGFSGSSFLMDADVATQVNSWVNEKTRGKIPKLLSQAPAALRLVILNAIYMKGTWKTPFKKNLTVDEDFFVTPGQAPVKVPTMKASEKMKYYHSEKFHAIDLEYKCDRQKSEIVGTFVLPFEQHTLESIEQEIFDQWQTWTSTPQYGQKVILSLPRFKIRGDFEASDAVQSIGIRKAFGPGAEFTNITENSQGFIISSIVHKAFVEVNEEGTEAAAATGIMMLMCMPLPETPVEMKFNRPFLFVVRDCYSGLILFIVRVNNPSIRDD